MKKNMMSVVKEIDGKDKSPYHNRFIFFYGIKYFQSRKQFYILFLGVNMTNLAVKTLFI